MVPLTKKKKPFKITYQIQDQFRHPIKQSAYAGKKPMIKENIGLPGVLSSNVPKLQKYINTKMGWTKKWKSKKSGEFRDMIKVHKIPIKYFNELRSGMKHFNHLMDDIGERIMFTNTTHQWSLSTSKKAIVAATQNTFASSVSDTMTPATGGSKRIKIRSVYTVNTP